MIADVSCRKWILAECEMNVFQYWKNVQTLTFKKYKCNTDYKYLFTLRKKLHNIREYFSITEETYNFQYFQSNKKYVFHFTILLFKKFLLLTCAICTNIKGFTTSLISYQSIPAQMLISYPKLFSKIDYF